MTDINPFDLKPVVIAGVELFTRPIEFEYDPKGEPIAATKYTATCPKCSQGLEFAATEIVESDGKAYFSACNECPLPSGLKSDAGFKDPIANGELKVDGAVKFEEA